MQRIDSSDSERVKQVKLRLGSLLESPLKELARALDNLLESVLSGASPEGMDATVDYIDALLNRIPGELDGRFYFDSYMIQSIGEKWNQGPFKCSAMIIPSYGREWGHEPILLPTVNSSALHRLDIIHFPQKSGRSTPSMIDYPWLCHELGHYLLSRDKGNLVDRFEPSLNQLLSQLKRRSIPDKGIAKSRAEETLNEISMYWHPTSRPQNWVREIVVDVIALWVCGPAYLAAFHREHFEREPFAIQLEHPPIELRTTALIEAAEMLGWWDYLHPLKSLWGTWQSKLSASQYNQYATLRLAELITTCVGAALEYCKYGRLPLLAGDALSRIRLALENDDELDGLDLIVAAWLVFSENARWPYEAWNLRAYEGVRDAVKW